MALGNFNSFTGTTGLVSSHTEDTGHVLTDFSSTMVQQAQLVAGAFTCLSGANVLD